MRRPARYAAVAATLLSLAACELAEVTTASSANVVVVEAVLRVGETQQRILLHRPPGASGATQVEKSDVVVIGPGGREIPFAAAPLQQCADLTRLPDNLAVRASCFTSAPADSGFVRPGAVYELRIRTAEGGSITGRTHVPGDFGLVPPLPTRDSATCLLPPRTLLPLVWTPAEGAWVYVAEVSIRGLRQALTGSGIDVSDIPDPLELTGLAISREDTMLVLPSEIGVFQRSKYDAALLLALQQGFPEGVNVSVTLAAADRNYVNAVRGGTFNPSGNVRISSVSGDGIGVFGSVVPRRLRVFVRQDAGGGLEPCLSAGSR